MKKSLIAVAALAAVSAASAQSSLNVYGVADVVIHKDDVRGEPSKPIKMTSGGVSGSRLGFKGTEDLGGGLKANFLLEQGINLTSGAAAGFNRQAYVGLSGGFGEVKFGNVYTAYDDISGATNPVFDSVLSPTSVWASTNYNSNPGSNIYYATPSFGGVSGAVSYSLDGSKNEVVSAHVKYEGGPIYVGLAYQDDVDFGTAFNTANAAAITAGTVAAKSADKYTRLNGSYDFGSFKLLAGYGKVKAADVTEYSIGADMPLSSNLVLSAGYASSKADGAKRDYGIAVGAAYSLSKRTTVYGGARNVEGNKDESRVGFGLKHTF
jgi:predicted porin